MSQLFSVIHSFDSFFCGRVNVNMIILVSSFSTVDRPVFLAGGQALPTKELFANKKVFVSSCKRVVDIDDST